ncbi:hypothetical protein BJV74DRAFT_817092 [Russula compacta]|nr:hypothetical protein BJV74DRAFT_817092 [Russula compacta]
MFLVDAFAIGGTGHGGWLGCRPTNWILAQGGFEGLVYQYVASGKGETRGDGRAGMRIAGASASAHFFVVRMRVEARARWKGKSLCMYKPGPCRGLVLLEAQRRPSGAGLREVARGGRPRRGVRQNGDMGMTIERHCGPAMRGVFTSPGATALMLVVSSIGFRLCSRRMGSPVYT